MARTIHRIDLTCGLFSAEGAPDPRVEPQTCSWFFDIPSGRDAPDAWEELLHRILYDRNVASSRQRPGNRNWYGMLSFEREALDPLSFLFWEGPNAEQFPWLAAERQMIWEPAACYIVSNDGRYEFLQGEEFSELLAWRLIEEEQITEEIASGFFDQYFGKPDSGARLLAARAERLLHFRTIQQPGNAFRKPVGAEPICSGPITGSGSPGQPEGS